MSVDPDDYATPYDWLEANKGKTLRRDRPDVKRTYTVTGLTKRNYSGKLTYLVQVINDRGDTGVIGYKDMKGMVECP